MKDKYGHEYVELQQEQAAHLLNWAKKLHHALAAEIVLYCNATNQPAATPNEVHRVYRGQDLVQIILEWPNLSPAYAAKKTKVEDGI